MQLFSDRIAWDGVILLAISFLLGFFIRGCIA